ncbi:MAG: lysophospholipid acyltransferase family protein [Thermosulfidibacteraceae bacterium]
MNFSSLLKNRSFLDIVKWFLRLLLPLYFATLRIVEINREVFDSKKAHIIYGFWHNRFVPLIHLHRNSGIYIMVSPSRDGDFIAWILERFGFRTIRGSTYKRVIGGTKELLGLLRRGERVAILLDGPRGPRYTVSPGLLKILDKLKVEIMPVTAEYTKYIRFNSWDRFMLPLPFSKVYVCYGEPFLPKDPVELRDRLFELEHFVKSRFLR